MFNQNYCNHNPNLNFNYKYQANYLRNNWNELEFYGNSDDNQKEIKSFPIRNRTQNFNRKNLNNCDRHLQSHEKYKSNYANPITNDYNEDYMNWNINSNINRMKEKKGTTKDDFYHKQAVNIKTQIPTEKNNKMSDFDREILKVFIYIYYYEKIAGEN